MSRPLIFISYSHRDEDWKDRILLHLGVAQKQERFDLWDDRRIKGGEDWFEATTNTIDAGCVNILLVSANSLTSNFILYEQIGDRYSIARGKAYYGSMLMDSGDSERRETAWGGS